MEAGAFPWTLACCSFKTVLQRTWDFQFSCAWWSISGSYRIFRVMHPLFLFSFSFLFLSYSSFSFQRDKATSVWSTNI